MCLSILKIKKGKERARDCLNKMTCHDSILPILDTYFVVNAVKDRTVWIVL